MYNLRGAVIVTLHNVIMLSEKKKIMAVCKHF